MNTSPALWPTMIIAAAAALLARRVLPRGLSAGVFIAAISCLALRLLGADTSGTFEQRAAGHVLTGLALLWYAVGRIIVCRHQTTPDPQSADAALKRDELEVVWSWSALVCGLAAAAFAIASTEKWIGAGWSPGCADLTPLLLLSLVVCAFRTSPAAYYPAAALAVLLLLAITPAEEYLPASGSAALVLFIAAAACLFTVIAVILLDWQRRRRRWMTSPHSLLDDPPSHTVIFSSVIAAGVLIDLASLPFLSAGLTPIALWLTSLAILTIGHVRNQLLISELGLLLTALGIVSAAQAWLIDGLFGVLLGLGIASGYCLWLTRFWEQQLNCGTAWTTAGSMIPVARQLAMCVVTGAIVVAFLTGLGLGNLSLGTPWAVTILVIYVILMSMFTRDWLEKQHPSSAWAALFAVLAAIGPSLALVGRPLRDIDLPLLAVSGMGLLLILRICIAPPGRAYNSVDLTLLTAVLRGSLPVFVSYALLWNGFTIPSTIALMITIGILILGARVLRERAPNIEPKGSG